MKLRFGILLVFFVIICKNISASNEGRSDEYLFCDDNASGSDTTSVNKFIKVNQFNLLILPPSSGVQFYKEGIVFLSSSKQEGKMLPSHLSFGKISGQYAVLNDSVLINQENFSFTSSFIYPCEAITFSSDFKTMYFTKSLKHGDNEKIYRAVFSQEAGNQGIWTEDANPVNFCNDKSIYTHPALSADGKLMIFASNRPGTIGGLDLFVTQEKGGIWSDPVNLGDAVNSQANELYPFLDSENNLFFSSDGSQGYGGYDIYVCKFKSNTWEKPINLGTPINTKFDDVAFKLNKKDSKSAFYTVKQNTGKKSIQLFEVKMNNSIPDPMLTISQYFTRPDISHMVILVLEPAVQATDQKPETVKPKVSESNGQSEKLVYRVQFLTSFNPRTRSQINVDGKDYKVFEYLYSGAYRLCAGEFSTISPAIELQNLLKKNDYPRASIVVFKNDVLSLDPELLKEQTVSGPPADSKSSEKVSLVFNKDTLKTETTKAETSKTIINAPENKKSELVKVIIPVPIEKKDIIVYRVQFLTNNTPKGSYKIVIAGKSYSTFEYQYAGGFRSTVGDFSTLSAATEFQNSVRQSGYPQAFVVAFKNNVRSTDPALFK
jgi:hypothetical protein